MKIKNIHIQNFKSLVDFKLEDLNPFCVFAGPNASGKSNIFEALEFTSYLATNGFGTFKFKDINKIYSFNPAPVSNFAGDEGAMKFRYEIHNESPVSFDVITKPIRNSDQIEVIGLGGSVIKEELPRHISHVAESEVPYGKKGYDQFINGFSRIFVGNAELRIINSYSNRLLIDASNLPQIIGQIFQDEEKRVDFIEWLQILIPEFQNIEVKKSNIDGSYDFFVYEKSSNKPFPRDLLSDGTKNILALMAAVYQSNEPQFLCIEEPENGLHPEAIEILIDFFRHMCETEGHHIWLNSHSPTLVRCIKINELILINKINGITIAKQFKEEDIVNIKTDEAWLTNALGGGVSWSN